MKPDRSAFLTELKSSFPALIEEINSQQGLFTFEVDVFRRFTQAQIDDGDRRAAKRCFEIAGKYYLHGNDRFRRIIDTCYVEGLDFKDSAKRSRSWAWDLFPPRLKDCYQDFWGRQPAKARSRPRRAGRNGRGDVDP